MSRPPERTYRFSRRIAALVELFGWTMAAVGVVLLLTGIGAVFLAAPAAPALGVLSLPLAILPGLLTTAAGLFAVQFAHHSRATYDIAVLTRDMATRARHAAGPAAGPTLRAVATPRTQPSLRAEPTLRRPADING